MRERPGLAVRARPVVGISFRLLACTNVKRSERRNAASLIRGLSGRGEVEDAKRRNANGYPQRHATDTAETPGSTLEPGPLRARSGGFSGHLDHTDRCSFQVTAAGLWSAIDRLTRATASPAYLQMHPRAGEIQLPWAPGDSPSRFARLLGTQAGRILGKLEAVVELFESAQGRQERL